MPLPGTIFVLALHGTTPACEAWDVDLAHGTLTHADTRMLFEVHGEELHFTEVDRGDGLSTCGDSLAMNDPRLFATRAACTQAIAHHARLAMDWTCKYDEEVAAPVVASTKHRFDDVLAYGGFMYSEDACRRVRFEAHHTTGTSIEGEMSYRIPGGLEDYGFEGERGSQTLALLGPATIMDDGEEFGLLCGDEVQLDYAADHVGVMGNLYFDQATCRAASEREAYRRSWLPNDEEARAVRLPLAGGC